MNIKRVIFPGVVALLAFGGGLTGCAVSQPARLYVVPATVEFEAMPEIPEHLRGARVALARIRIPTFLDRAPIVTRVSGGEITYSEFDRWGGPLANNLEDVLCANLGTLLPDSFVALERAMPGADIDYLVGVQILELAGDGDGQVGLTAQWATLRGQEDTLLTTRVSRLKTPLEGSDHVGYVAAVGRLLADLSREIVTVLTEAPDPSGPGGRHAE